HLAEATSLFDQSLQNGSGNVVRKICDYACGWRRFDCGAKISRQGIGFDEFEMSRAGKLCAQCGHEIAIDFDCDDAPCFLDHTRSQSAMPRTDFDYGFVRTRVNGLDDSINHAKIDEEVLTEATLCGDHNLE